MREAAFRAWDRGALVEPRLAPRLGVGRYGTVVECAGGWPGCAAKVLLARTWHARRQAYREHVVGLLQSILLLERVTPHFPWHYGAELSVTGTPDLQLSVVLFMERYPSSLPDAAPQLLTTPDAWAVLLFQLAHAATTLAAIFGVVQNDAYPRNALVRPCARTAVVYDVAGQRYVTRAHFVAVLTDYGIASGELVVAPTAPEVVAADHGARSRLAASAVSAARGRFAAVKPTAHVLAYRDLPIYARDLAMLLKWPAIGDLLPAPPAPVHLWAQGALLQLDRAADALEAPGGLLASFHEIFAEAHLARYGIRGGVRAAPATTPADFTLRLEAREGSLAQAQQALAQAQAEDEAWAPGPRSRPGQTNKATT